MWFKRNREPLAVSGNLKLLDVRLRECGLSAPHFNYSCAAIATLECNGAIFEYMFWGTRSKDTYWGFYCNRTDHIVLKKSWFRSVRLDLNGQEVSKLHEAGKKLILSYLDMKYREEQEKKMAASKKSQKTSDSIVASVLSEIPKAAISKAESQPSKERGLSVVEKV
jgi:hypothetical protein